MAKKVNALINPALLKWARVSGEFTLEDAANRLKVDESKIIAWEEGETKPSFSQLKKIAKTYRRPIAAFYLPEPPNRNNKPFSDINFIDYRNLPDSEKDNDTPASLFELRKAEVRRKTLLEIDRLQNIETKNFILNRNKNEGAISLAERVRELLKVSIEQQKNWQDHALAYRVWRRAIEELSVLVFQTRYIRNFTVDTREWRGATIHYPQLPIIIVNRQDKPQARIFTLFHELCHLIRQESSLVSKDSISGRQEEIYCNRFAGNLLVPDVSLNSEQIVREHVGRDNWSDEEIWELCKLYSVSRVVVLRRLMDLGYTTNDFYSYKVNQYEDEAKAEKSKEEKGRGRAVPHKQPLNTHGGLFVSKIFRAYREDYLTLLDVTQHLDTKTKHIKAIQRELPNYYSPK